MELNVSSADQLKKRNITTVGCILVFITLVMALFLNKMFSPRIMSLNELRINGAIVFDNPRIIKDFELVDHHNTAFTRDNLKGKWTLMYFGFTRCPDICPTMLSDLNRMSQKLDETILSQTQVVMVTADPARDTVEVLGQYIPYFNPHFIGITGEFFPIRALASNLNVAFNKVPLDGKNMENGYTVDHTGNLILINPKGDYHGFFKPPFELAKLKTTYQSIVSTFPY